MNFFSNCLLGKTYWPLDLLVWAVGLLLFFQPYISHYSKREIGRFANFIYFFWLFLIAALSSFAWWWLLFDVVKSILQINFAKIIILTSLSVFFVYVLFEDFFKEVFAFKKVKV